MGEYIEESRNEYVSVSKSKRGGLGLGDKIYQCGGDPSGLLRRAWYWCALLRRAHTVDQGIVVRSSSGRKA